MKFGFYSNKWPLFLLFLLIFAVPVFAQKGGPRDEKLLNGLKVLMWHTPKADKITVKVRVHSGSSFDPQQKEGVMRVLADNIFPNEAARDVFREDYGGSLDVTSNYDYIQVTATARPEHLVDVIQTLAAAVASITIDKETTVRLRTALLEKVKALDKNPAYLADIGAATRLFGTFPYGRPQMGSVESVQRIDYADLIQAKERFLTADNATVTLTGNYNSDLAYRAVRRYFGAWLKSDKKTPSTFRQPDDPDTNRYPFAATGTKEMRYALRGLAKADPDFPASEILMRVTRYRWQDTKPGGLRIENASVRHESHILPGHVIFGFTLPAQPIDEAAALKLGASLIPSNITEAEFARAKSEIIAELSGRDIQERWLDVDTFKSLPVDAETSIYQNASLADVQRVADRLAKNPVASFVYAVPAEAAAPAN